METRQPIEARLLRAFRNADGRAQEDAIRLLERHQLSHQQPHEREPAQIVPINKFKQA